MPDFKPGSRRERPHKILYIGHTGSGKTGSTVALAAAGYNVVILDLDEGTDIIEDYVCNPQSIYRKPRLPLWDQRLADTLHERISAVTITEGYNIRGMKAIPKADAWNRIQQQLNNWIDPPRNFGNIGTWPSNTVLVIDGLSRLCEAAMHTQLALNGRLETGPRVGTSDTNDYSAAYGLILSFLDMLKSSEIKCHIIMCCHIAFLVEDQHDRQSPTAQRDMRGFPQTVGRKIGPMIGQFFNHALRAKVIGTSPGRHVIMTASDEYIDLKTTKPLKVQKEYNLETGLAEYFYALRQPPTA